MKKYLLGFGVVLLTGTGCFGSTDEPQGLSYVTKNTQVTSGETIADMYFEAVELAENSNECGIGNNEVYYQPFIKGLQGKAAQNYVFMAAGDMQDPPAWLVTLLPNVTGYTSFESFKRDFDICGVGGIMYPLMLNKDWLVFSSSCGSGYADDSDRPVGCEEAKKNTTIGLNPPAFK